MKIRKIIDKVLKVSDNPIFIEYRTYTPGGQDILFGTAEYRNGEIHSLDGDTYTLDDEMTKFDYLVDTEETYLTVWYKSLWLS